MAPIFVNAFVGGIFVALGSKVGTDYVYPWMIKKVKILTKILKDTKS